MKIIISTYVTQAYEKVTEGFGRELLTALNPPFPPVKLLRYDGNKRGDEVYLQLNFLLFKQVWKSRITEDYKDEGKSYFIDEGIKLPFFLSHWRHKHLIIKKDGGTIITDDISFRTPFFVLDLLIFPIMYLQFLYRKPIYKKYFRKEVRS